MISFITANKYFGRKEGQSLAQFSIELKDLTPKDREELAPLLTKALLGEEVTVA